MLRMQPALALARETCCRDRGRREGLVPELDELELEILGNRGDIINPAKPGAKWALGK